MHSETIATRRCYENPSNIHQNASRVAYFTSLEYKTPKISKNKSKTQNMKIESLGNEALL